jgi:hypothetical protein
MLKKFSMPLTTKFQTQSSALLTAAMKMELLPTILVPLRKFLQVDITHLMFGSSDLEEYDDEYLKNL